MVNAKVLYNTLVSKLSLPESAEEINALAFGALQHLGVSKTDVLSNQEVKIDTSKLNLVIDRLNRHEPLQYIFNEAWFYGRKFFVDPNVLIPRPETEQLIDIVKRSLSKDDVFNILDIGTGSGCIAISLALEFPRATILATDVSLPALKVAQQNAQALGTVVNFIENDILKGLSSLEKFDLIVSNPPYIAQSERESLPNNVLQHEPHLALFAAENDALIFYRAITKAAYPIMRESGVLAVEINERLGHSVLEIFRSSGFSDLKVHQDMFGKERFATARKGIKNAPFHHK